VAGESETTIRRLSQGDPATISAAFAAIGWNKPRSQYEAYLLEQQQGAREILVASVRGDFAGYVTVNWHPTYLPFAGAGVPEVQDFNVLPRYRRRGIGSLLMDRAEQLVAERSAIVGIGVGMYADYGNAQRLYVKRGYIPDGRGLTYKGRVLEPLEQAVNDDDLVLFFTKHLR